jgi:hypothetical protein
LCATRFARKVIGVPDPVEKDTITATRQGFPLARALMGVGLQRDMRSLQRDYLTAKSS